MKHKRPVAQWRHIQIQRSGMAEIPMYTCDWIAFTTAGLTVEEALKRIFLKKVENFLGSELNFQPPSHRQ